MPQLIVIVEILVTQRQTEDSLGQQVPQQWEGLERTAMIGETLGKSANDPRQESPVP